MYSTASSSISEVFVCLSILGTTPCNFFIRSLIRVRRTRSAILRGCVAHPRLARVPLTVSRKEVSSTTGLICVLPTGRLICLVRLPATPGLLLIEPSAIWPDVLAPPPGTPRWRLPLILPALHALD
jgi:hypothetical protein